MNTWLKNITPKNIQQLIPYSSARREATEGDIWLNANENPFPRSTVDHPGDLNRYPEFQPVALVEAYANYAGIKTDQLLITRGIDEGLDLLVRGFCRAGDDQIVYTPPTYGMYRITAETHGVQCVATPLLANWKLDTPQVIVEAGDSKLVFLCSPNNPTGNLLKRSAVIEVLESARNQTLIVLDEAYIEFMPESSYVDLLSEYSNLVVLRTLSKAFGLAGLRCGFVMASPEIISTLKKISAPYPIPVPVVDLALTALADEGIARMKQEVKIIQVERESLADSIRQFSFVKEVYPGNANFVLLRVGDAVHLMDALSQKGIIIRNQSSQVQLENCVRITMGTVLEIKTLLSALEEYEARG